MITGIPEIDNGLHEVADNLKKSLEKSEKFKNDMIIKLKNSNLSEKEYIIFKSFFNGLNDDEEQIVMNVLKKYPLLFNKFLWIISDAKKAKEYSESAIYNRSKSGKKIMSLYKVLLDKMTKLAKELNINNSLELSILFSYLLWNGYLSKTKKHEYTEFEGPLLIGMNFTDITNGMGVCRNYSEMLKDFLEFNGYSSIMLANYFDDNTKIEYTMNIDERKIYNVSSEERFTRKKANHAFNLIDDNGLYVYDSTNLLLYDIKNQKYSVLVNGKGKNIIYPYRSYDFCYSKEDEKLLDRIFTDDKFTSPYTKTDFISISEVTLEILRNFTSLLDDFYTEARQDILGISEETKKALTRKR